MNSNRKAFIVVSVCFLSCFLVIDLKNYIVNGSSFIVTGDAFDTLKYYLTIPGYYPTFFIILLMGQNVHNYNYFIMEIFTLLLSSSMYGWVVSLLFRVRNGKRN